MPIFHERFQARIYPKTERYWYYTRKVLVRQYRVTLKKRRPNKGSDGGPEAGKLFDLDSMEISEEIEQPAKGGSKKSMALQLASQFIQGK